MPLQVAYATSSGVFHFKWRMPLQVACHSEWRMPLQVACHSEWRMPLQVACHCKWRMPLQVACRTVSMPFHATSSGVSHREHATSCHFKWRMPLQVACRTVSMPLHATSSGVKWREVAKSVYAPPACSMKKTLHEDCWFLAHGRNVHMPVHCSKQFWHSD